MLSVSTIIIHYIQLVKTNTSEYLAMYR